MRLRTALGLSLLATTSLLPALRADGGLFGTAQNVVYIPTNNPLSGENAVLAYTRNPTTGAVTPIHGSPFLTGGTGFLNATEVLGPDDSDQEIVVTPDHHFLYVVNQGSNTITGFFIQSDGSLRPVLGSPFPSGGIQPDSIGFDGIFLFVANRGDQNPGGGGGTHKPTYQSFLILPEGSLLPIPVPQPSLGAGSSPTQMLVSPNGQLVFDSHVFENPFNNAGFPAFLPPASSELHSYKVNIIGQLTPAAQTAPPAPIPPFIFGLAVHPTKNILYTGYVVAGGVGTYSYDNSGNMTLASFTPGAPNGGPCWVVVSPDAKTIYTADAITDQVDVYSVAADPLHPVLTQTVNLAGVKNPVDFNIIGAFWDTMPFQMKISPDGKFLYVVSHEASNLTGGNLTGNALHILKIGTGGTLTEIAGSPLVFPPNEVPMTAHPLGVVVF